MNRVITSIFLTFTAMTTWAQESGIILQGYIQDGFLGRGLFDCKVSLLREDSTAVECYPQVHEVGNDSMHISTIYYIGMSGRSGNYLVRVQKDGYDDGWAKITIPEEYKKKTFEVPIINIRKSIMKTVGLNEVVVKATRIKVKMRGDTLVYDATAFQLPEGSMLQHLIEQLPGARMTDAGEIFINGRKIDELTLNSRSLFGGNKKIMMENLPYFTVKELKVFERQSLEAALKGIKDEHPEYVMDVNLKDEYSVGMIANTEVAGGTHDRYQARTFGLLLTKTLAMGLFGNMNNINDITRAISQGWNVGSGLVLGNQNKPSRRNAAGVSFDYQSTKKWSGFPVMHEIMEISFDHINNLDKSGTYQERFLPAGSAFAQNNHHSRDKITAVQVSNTFRWAPWIYDSSLLFFYKETENSMLDNLQQWDTLHMTATQQTESLGKTKLYGLGWAHVRFPIFKVVQGTVNAWWTRSERNGFSRQCSSSGSSATDYLRHEYQDAHTTDYKFEPSWSYDRQLWKQLHVYLTERYKISGNNSNDQLYILNNLTETLFTKLGDCRGLNEGDSVDISLSDSYPTNLGGLVPSNNEMLRRVFDAENSTYSRLNQQENEFTIALKWNRTQHFPVDVTLRLPVYVQHERLNYQRGMIDTLARHNLFTLNPSLNLRHDVWTLNVGVTSSTPGLMNLMPYRDARNALRITEGNPSLKNNRRVNASMMWQPKLKTKEIGITAARLTSSYTYHIRSVAQGFTYDEQTSAYTYRPENVEGNWSWNTSYNTTLSLNKNQLWWIDSSTGCNVWHSVDYASIVGMTDAQLNKVETVNLSENLKMSYKAKNTKVTLLADMLWRRTWGHRGTFSGISAFNFHYGMNAMQTVPKWNTTFNIDAMMSSRRGYGSDAMNKDEFVVNASVTQTILHGKVKLAIEGHDILHQLSNTTYEVNAQGRTETWYRVIPSYVMLRASYHFNKNPKNK